VAEERLQKILSKSGVASRRKAEELIEAGRVTVNGAVATLGDKADPERDHVKVDGKLVPPAVPDRYFVVNKPDGYVSTRHDPEGRPTVMDLIPPKFHKALVPVGRLDYHTEGLLLLTTDGDWAQKVAHPRHGCAKTYEVKVKGVPSQDQVWKLRRGGMKIEGTEIGPATVEKLRTTGRGDEGNSWWTVEIAEGKTRQVREMFFRLGHPVQKLRRVAIGPLTDAHLPRGAARELSPPEVEALRRAGGKTGRPKPGARGQRAGGKAKGRGSKGTESKGTESKGRESKGRESKGRGSKGRGSKGRGGTKR